MSTSDFIFCYFWIFSFLFGLNFTILSIKTEEDHVLNVLFLIISILGLGITLIAFIEWYKDQYRKLNNIKKF